MYTPLSDKWKEVFTKDTEQETFTYVVIDGIKYDDGQDGRLDAVRPSVPAETFIGGFNMLMYEIELYVVGIEETASQWVGKSVEIFEGYEGTEMISKGVFTVDEEGIEFADNGTTVKVFVVDNAYLFDKKIEPLTLPATGRQIMEEIATRTGSGIEAVTPNLLKDDFSDFSHIQGSTYTLNKTFPIEIFKGGKNIQTLPYGGGRLPYWNVITATMIDNTNELSLITTTGSAQRFQGNMNMVKGKYTILFEYKSDQSMKFASSTEMINTLDKTFPSSPNEYRKAFFNFEKENDLNALLRLYVEGSNGVAGIKASVRKIKIVSGHVGIEEPYSPAPEDGYGYTGNNGAWHITAKDGNNLIKFYGRAGATIKDGTDCTSIDVFPFIPVLINNNAQNKRPSTNEFNHLEWERVGNGITQRQIQMRTDEVEGSIDLIARNPRIWEDDVPYVPELPFDSYTFENLNVNVGQNISYRQIVNNYAQINGVMATIGRNGKLNFIDVINGAKTGVRIDGDIYEKINVQNKVGTINSLKITRSDSTGEEDYDSITISDDASIEAEGITQVRMSNNIFIDMFPEEVIDKVFNIIRGYSYNPVTIEGMFPHFELDQGDIITVVALNGNEYDIPYMAYSWNYGGGISATLETVALPETLPDYTLESINQRLQLTEFKVNKVTNEITGIALTQEQINDTLTEQSGKLALTDSLLQIEIADRVLQGEDLVKQTATLIEQTTQNIRFDIIKTREDIDELTGEMGQFRVYFNFDENLTIGKSDSPYKMILGTEAMQFLDNGTVQTEISRQRLYTERIVVRQSAQLGNHIIEKSPFDDNRTLWRKVF